MKSISLSMAKANFVSLVLLLLQLSASLGQDYPFQNPSLSWDVRVKDLINRLSLEEMVLQMARGGAMQNGPAPAIPHLGIKPYNWNTECLRGDVQAPGYATSYPEALGLAASFSPELILKVANATATEVRAKHNYFMSVGNYHDHTGLSCFSPVINIMRHPLWGRNQETYGEDPYLSGLLATSFVKGLQGDHPRYIKANAGCKHFDVHGGPENIPVSRFSFDAKVEERDWRMTFLPQFQACVEAGTYSIMCSYNRQVIGPFAHSAPELFGDYAPYPDPQYISTPRDGIAQLPVEVSFAAGCSDPQCKTYSSEEIKTLVGAVDITILCLGTGTSVEMESKDRENLMLPGLQATLLKDAVASAAGRPVVLLLFNAGPLNISWAQNSTGVHAVLECFFPAQAAGTAIAKVLTGAQGANPAGRLPATWPAGMDQVPAMENYTMHGRTYRYYGKQIPLYPFGYGLSYTTFQYSDLVVTPSILQLCGTLDLSVQVKNSGLRTGDEVIQVYMSWSNASVPVPRWQLVGIQRVTIPLSGSVKVSFSVLPRQRAVWTKYWILEPGEFSLYVGGQQPFQITKVPSNVLHATFTVQGEVRPLNTC
ncbi:uncharacterized protein ACNLHF_009238 [Anomaloglossus baeobatrachus]|uniref:uncharacterized protein LOC142289775 n=1 Tax=Anomaloglossus baeobatrachus TaxID=238106 RepID=UPI003F4F7FDB